MAPRGRKLELLAIVGVPILTLLAVMLYADRQERAREMAELLRLRSERKTVMASVQMAHGHMDASVAAAASANDLLRDSGMSQAAMAHVWEAIGPAMAYQMGVERIAAIDRRLAELGVDVSELPAPPPNPWPEALRWDVRRPATDG